MDERGAREVDVVDARDLVGEPAAAPHPVRLDGIDDGTDDEGVDAVGEELGAFCHRARDDGRRCRAEHEVEEEGRPVIRLEIREQVEIGDADEPEEGVLSHQEPRPEQHEHDGAEAEVQKVLHDDVARVLCAREARFHHGKPCLHEPDEDGADQKPNARRSENVHKITSKICS